MSTTLSNPAVIGAPGPSAGALAVAEQALRILAEVRSGAELKSCLEGAARRLGFDYFSYVLSDRMQLGGVQAASAMLATSYPQPWRQRYERRRYHQLDPVVTVGSRMRQPFFWGSAEYLRQLPPSRRRVFDEARTFGIRSGFTVPVHGPGGECGLFTVSCSGGIGDCEGAAEGSRLLLQVLGAQAHAVVVERLTGHAEAAPVSLTEHERVCLSWTMRGKTAWEIAQILNRSRPTIDFHLQKATRKLGAANKFHAAFKALQAGLI